MIASDLMETRFQTIGTIGTIQIFPRMHWFEDGENKHMEEVQNGNVCTTNLTGTIKVNSSASIVGKNSR